MESKVTKEMIKSKIQTVEYVKHITCSGQILRWAVIIMKNGFAVTGDPAAAVDPANDDMVLGREIALENAMHKVWVLEGYLLKDKLYN